MKICDRQEDKLEQLISQVKENVDRNINANSMQCNLAIFELLLEKEENIKRIDKIENEFKNRYQLNVAGYSTLLKELSLKNGCLLTSDVTDKMIPLKKLALINFSNKDMLKTMCDSIEILNFFSSKDERLI